MVTIVTLLAAPCIFLFSYLHNVIIKYMGYVTDDFNCFQMKTALKDQQEVNDQLRAYIDNILLNIVENHPELLEVKQNL